MLIVKRKNLVMGILISLLVITGYLNLVYNQSMLNDNDLRETLNEQKGDGIVVKDDKIQSNDQPDDTSDVPAFGSSNFFVNYRLERENTRKQEIEYIREIIDNPASDPDIKKEAQAHLLEITKNMEKEMAIEALIRAKGFKDVVVILHKDSINVIVDKEELKQEEVAQILDIVRRESGQQPENIKIIPKI